MVKLRGGFLLQCTSRIGRATILMDRDGQMIFGKPGFNLHRRITGVLSLLCTLIAFSGCARCPYAEGDASAGDWVKISAGSNFTCGIRADCSVECWGDNWDNSDATPPPDSLVEVSTGGGFACGIDPGREIVCWEADHEEDTGAASKEEPSGKFQALAADGGAHACAIDESGEATCWGWNDYGQASPPPGDYVSVTAGLSHSCGILEGGEISCWGSDYYGQLGSPEGEFSSISAGGNHTCALDSSGSAICWGKDDYGQCSPPQQSLVEIDGGIDHNCARATDNSITCWGLYYPDGSGNSNHDDVPDGQFESVTAGGEHSCGLRDDGTYECWGSNLYGQVDPSSA